MSETQTNIYKTAREYAGLNRIKAAEKLGISPSCLKDYEIDWRQCPDVIALAMSKLYRTPWLRVQHLQKNIVFCDVFGLIPPSDDLAVNMLRAQKEVGEVVELFPQMVAKTVQKKHLGDSLLKECREGAQALLVLIGIEEEQKEKTPHANREPLTYK
jgi:hypothetical protein